MQYPTMNMETSRFWYSSWFGVGTRVAAAATVSTTTHTHTGKALSQLIQAIPSSLRILKLNLIKKGKVSRSSQLIGRERRESEEGVVEWWWSGPGSSWRWCSPPSREWKRVPLDHWTGLTGSWPSEGAAFVLTSILQFVLQTLVASDVGVRRNVQSREGVQEGWGGRRDGVCPLQTGG
jgi:hypothetical protein